MLTYRVVPDVPEIPRPSQLWKRLSSELKLLAADAFWQDENAAAEQAEAVVMIAQRIKFRTRSVQTLPREKKARHLVNLGAVSEMVAARLLVAYHLHHQRAMMGGFLDALGITHENGLIADEEVKPPSAERLRDAARAIGATHPAEDVALYLSTLMWQDPETWAGLSELPELAQHA
jgi:3-dehydroquinate synthetase